MSKLDEFLDRCKRLLDEGKIYPYSIPLLEIINSKKALEQMVRVARDAFVEIIELKFGYAGDSREISENAIAYIDRLAEEAMK